MGYSIAGLSRAGKLTLSDCPNNYLGLPLDSPLVSNRTPLTRLVRNPPHPTPPALSLAHPDPVPLPSPPLPRPSAAVEEAVRLRERNKSLIDHITVVSIGPPKAQDVLRTALAMGADSAIHIEHKDGDVVEPLAVAKALAAVVGREQPNLVIMGKQAIDDDASQVGGMLGGLLGWPQANFASSVEVRDEGKGVEVAREIDGGLETLRMTLPAIVTTDLRLNEPRYASLPNIMKASRSSV